MNESAVVIAKLERQSPVGSGSRYYLTKYERDIYVRDVLKLETIQIYARRKISLVHPYYRGAKIYLEKL